MIAGFFSGGKFLSVLDHKSLLFCIGCFVIATLFRMLLWCYHTSLAKKSSCCFKFGVDHDSLIAHLLRHALVTQMPEWERRFLPSWRRRWVFLGASIAALHPSALREIENLWVENLLMYRGNNFPNAAFLTWSSYCWLQSAWIVRTIVHS